MSYISSNIDLQAVFSEIKMKFIESDHHEEFNNFTSRIFLSKQETKAKKRTIRNEEEEFNEAKQKRIDQNEQDKMEVFTDNLSYVADTLRNSLTETSSMVFNGQYVESENHFNNLQVLLQLERGFQNNIIRVKFNIGKSLRFLKGSGNIFSLKKKLEDNNISISKSEIYFTLRFFHLIEKFPKILNSSLPISFFKNNFKYLNSVCENNKTLYTTV